MIRSFRSIVAATALIAFAAPAIAQGEEEEARTTYSISYLKFAPGADERWSEIHEQYVVPARTAAGMPTQQVHWLMAGEWDLMVVAEMPEGLASLDRHGGPKTVAFDAAMLEMLKTEEAVEALNEEANGLVADYMRTYSHTHP